MVGPGATFSVVRPQDWANGEAALNPNSARDGTPFEAGNAGLLGVVLQNLGLARVPRGEDLFFLFCW